MESRIKEINKEISGALEFWMDVMNKADADQWAYFLDYSDRDLLNVVYIFNHVAQNRAIKSGYIDVENATQKISAFKDAIKEAFGFDTIELTQKVLNLKEDNTNQKQE